MKKNLRVLKKIKNWLKLFFTIIIFKWKESGKTKPWEKEKALLKNTQTIQNSRKVPRTRAKIRKLSAVTEPTAFTLKIQSQAFLLAQHLTPNQNNSFLYKSINEYRRSAFPNNTQLLKTEPKTACASFHSISATFRAPL